jgi:xanthine dehydrogenase iron-sulfur cluster and FAD-binding subunit A
MHPVQQAFRECHGLQCGFCTPGFLTTVAAYLEHNPDPTEAEAREAISGNLCRCTGYQNIVASVLRAAEITPWPRGGGAVTTKLFGEPVQRVEDAKLVTGGAHFLDDLGQDALAAAFVRSPHAHARVREIDVTGASRSTGSWPSTPTTTWCWPTRPRAARWPTRCRC